MKDPKLELPTGMTRVLIEHSLGAFEFAFYKDGMFRCDNGRDWISPKMVKRWISIPDLKSKLNILKTTK